ncbi:MAG: quercetin dioxygenase-like cupin family protein [Rhodothermales bacterium]|jgi:quercetin dioxygenase-like cupin family protein
MEDATHYRWDDIPKESLSEGLDRKMVWGNNAMAAQIFLAKGAVVPMHDHHNEQITYVLSGGLRFTIGREDPRTVDVLAGEVLVIPAHVPHAALALEDTLDLDFFTPPRQDWIEKTDAYLRGDQ